MKIELRPYTEKEYHQFFQGYVADPLMEPMPFVYNRESQSPDPISITTFTGIIYAHFGIFNERQEPLGCFQLKRMDEEKRRCEFGIILQNDKVKDQGHRHPGNPPGHGNRPEPGVQHDPDHGGYLQPEPAHEAYL